MSRLLRAAWIAAHGVAIASLSLSGLPAGIIAAIAAALLANAGLRRPPTAPGFTLRLGGTWSVPAWDVTGLSPAAGSFQTPWIIRIVLRCPGGRTRVLLVPRDCMPPDQWRAIRALLGAG